MRGLLSLDQELRAVRRGSGSKDASRTNHVPGLREAEQPWKQDIEQIQQTMREVLRAIAGLSGVELPGLPPGLEDDGALLPPLDIKTLKDRFRNELEAFSIKTTEELARRARQQAQAALDAVQNEVMDGRIDRVAADLRQKLQSPAQIEKFVEPAVKEAVASLERSFSQKVEQLFAEQQRLAENKLQGALSSVQAQVSTQVDAQFREILQIPEHIEKLVEPAVEEAAARLETSISQKVDRLFAEQQRLAEDKLQGTLSFVRAQVSTHVDAELRAKLQTPAEIEKLVEPRVGEAASRLEASISQKVHHLFAEQQRLVQDNLQGTLSSLQVQVSTLEQTVQEIREQKAEPVAQLSAEPLTTTIEKSLSQKVEILFAKQEHFVQEKLQGAMTSVQTQINTLQQTLQQVRLQRADSLAQLSTERSSAPLEKSLSEKVEHLFAQQELSVQDKLQGTLTSVQAQISTLQQTVQQMRLQQANSLAQLSAERSNANLEKSLSEKVDHLFAQQEQSVQDKLRGTLSSVQNEINTLQQTVQQIRLKQADSLAQLSTERSNATVEKSLSEKVQNLFAEQEYSVHDKLQGALSPIQAHISSLEQALQQIRLQQANSLAQLSAERSNATIEKSLSEKVERLFAQQEQLIQSKLQGTLSSIQAQISTLEKTVQKVRADSLAQLSAEQSNAAVDNSTKKYETGLNTALGGGIDQAAKRVESSFNKLLETFKSQPVQSTVGRPQEKPAEVLFDDPVMNLRVQQAMDYLDRLGSKSPQPVS